MIVKRSIRGAAAVFVALSLAAACGVESTEREITDTPDGGAWDAVRLTALDEVEGYSDVLSMRDAADLVVVGSFSGFERGREVTIPNGLGDGEDDVLIWVDGRLVIDEILDIAEHMEPLEDVLADGVISEDGTVLTVEFFAGGVEAVEQIDEGIAAMNADLVDEGAGERDQRAVLFLRMNGGPGEPVLDDPENVPSLEELRAATDVCEIAVGGAIVDGLADGEMFDPAVHYPGYDEKLHSACLFILPGDGARVVDIEPAQGDTDDLGRLRLTWTYGLVTGTSDHPVDAPLGEHVDEEMPAGTQDEIEDPRDAWADLDEFIDYVRTG